MIDLDPVLVQGQGEAVRLEALTAHRMAGGVGDHGLPGALRLFQLEAETAQQCLARVVAEDGVTCHARRRQFAGVVHYQAAGAAGSCRSGEGPSRGGLRLVQRSGGPSAGHGTATEQQAPTSDLAGSHRRESVA